MTDEKEFKVEVHCVDGWEAIYVNGSCQMQNHSGVLEEWLAGIRFPARIISYVREYHSYDDAVTKDIESAGVFPDTLEELNLIAQGDGR